MDVYNLLIILRKKSQANKNVYTVFYFWIWQKKEFGP